MGNMLTSLIIKKQVKIPLALCQESNNYPLYSFR